MNQSEGWQKHRQHVASTASAIASEIEAGRASTPFQTELKLLAGPLDLPIRAAIIADQPEDMQLLLSEIIGHDYNICKVVVPSRLGFSEVLLQERGFLLDTGAGPREFEDPGAFLAAVQQAHALQPGREQNGLEPLRLKLKGPAQLNGLCLLVPHSLEALQRKPALLSILADQADWVFLVGNPKTAFAAEQRGTIQLLLDHVGSLQCVLNPAGNPTVIPQGEWWKNWKVTLSLGLVRAGTDLLRNRLRLLTDPQSELRQYLVEVRLLRRLDMALALMIEETQQTQRQLTTRLSLAREGLTDHDAQTQLRKNAEDIRQKFGEELDSLVKGAEREAKAALQADGEINRQLREACATLTADDIEQTDAQDVIRLTVAPATSARLTDTVLRLARQRLSSDLNQFHEGLDCSINDARRAIEQATGTRPALSFDLPDESTLWGTIANLARPEIRFRGEMTRVTLGARFGAARQTIMGLMILGTVLSGVAVLTGEQGSGSNARTYLAAFMLPMLVIGFLWTYVSFRKKHARGLDKEVEKLQDGVFGELRRVLNDLHREQMSILGAAVQKAQRSIQQQIEAGFDQLDKQRQREAEDSRRRQVEQQRSIDQRLGRLRQLGNQLTALQANLKDGQRLLSQWLAAWIERFNQGKI